MNGTYRTVIGLHAASALMFATAASASTNCPVAAPQNREQRRREGWGGSTPSRKRDALKLRRSIKL